MDDKADLKERLELSYVQPETKGFIFPRHVFYYQYIERLKRDSIRRIEYERKGLKPPRGPKRWSDIKLEEFKPVIYDSAKAKLTTEAFETQLNLAGYREADATFKTITSEKLTDVYYKVVLGPRIYIDTFMFSTTDSSLRPILEKNKGKTFFPEGSPLDILLYNKEKTRIVNLFQNEGYARFDETYIGPLEVDTANNYVRATLPILNETDSTLHKKYYVGTVTIYPNYRLTDTSYLYDTIVRNVTYITPTPYLTIKTEAIERNLFLHPGDLTRKENVSQTLRNLSRMQLIKYVTPAIEVDTVNRDIPRINYTLYLTRNKKINDNFFAELNYANLTSTQSSLLGTSASYSYNDRNFLKGAEILNINLEAGVEFNFFNKNTEGNRDAINSENYGVSANLSYPRYVDPLGLYGLVGYQKTGAQPSLIRNRLRRWLLYDANSRIKLNYNYVNLHDLYRYYTVVAGLTYDVIPDQYRTLTIDRMGFDLFVPTIINDDLFFSPLQKESFRKYLFTGILFRKYFYELKPPVRIKRGYFGMSHGFEISGLEVFLLNQAFKKEFVIGARPVNGNANQIEFSHFVKGEIDVRFYYNFNSTTQFAMRFNPGIASPFGPYSQQVPYIKQFYVGGPLSNRAWQVRELGPGSYQDPTDVGRFAFYQTGDIKLDMSAELRFPLIWYLKGAVFIDASNVWTIGVDTAREEKTHFRWNSFLSELGIGYGFGFRLDLEYFIIRMDVGYKLHSPYDLPSEEGKNKWYRNRFPFEGGVVHFAIGLPF